MLLSNLTRARVDFLNIGRIAWRACVCVCWNTTFGFQPSGNIFFGPILWMCITYNNAKLGNRAKETWKFSINWTRNYCNLQHHTRVAVCSMLSLTPVKKININKHQTCVTTQHTSSHLTLLRHQFVYKRRRSTNHIQRLHKNTHTRTHARRSTHTNIK